MQPARQSSVPRLQFLLALSLAFMRKEDTAAVFQPGRPRQTKRSQVPRVVNAQ